MAETATSPTPSSSDSPTTAFKSKTQASIEAKGDKSYYYWHTGIKGNVPIEPPPLVKKTVEVVKDEDANLKKIINYAWMDDEKNVKIYVDLAKVGDESLGVAELAKENVSCTFVDTGFDLIIRNYKGGDHRLKITTLKHEINKEASSVLQRPSRIIISLRKADESKTWFELMKK